MGAKDELHGRPENTAQAEGDDGHGEGRAPQKGFDGKALDEGSHGPRGQEAQRKGKNKGEVQVKEENVKKKRTDDQELPDGEIKGLRFLNPLQKGSSGRFWKQKT